MLESTKQDERRGGACMNRALTVGDHQPPVTLSPDVQGNALAPRGVPTFMLSTQMTSSVRVQLAQANDPP